MPPDCPYTGRFWAPEIHHIKGRYWTTVNSGKVTVEDPKGMSTHSVWLFVADAVTEYDNYDFGRSVSAPIDRLQQQGAVA